MNRTELIEPLSADAAVIVCGLGITGIETALWLRREGRAVTVVEKLTQSQYAAADKFHRQEELNAAGVEVAFGVDGEGIARFVGGEANRKRANFVILSPGISLASSLVGALKRLNVPFVTELELGVLLAGVPTIMVTGSNGKSTTVSLIHHLLTAVGKRSLLCGNVGTPVVSEFRKGELENGLSARFDWLVVEASSYQLEACQSLAPDIGVLLNLSDNHLERHGSMERYREAKLSMVLRQGPAQIAVLNRDDSLIYGVKARLPSKILTFGVQTSSSTSSDANVDGEKVWITFGGKKESFETDRSKLIGAHNRQNIAASLIALAAAGVELSRSASTIQSALNSFIPLEHRLESVGTFNGVKVINDSKSTTVASTVAAVRAILSGSDLLESGERVGLVLCVGGAAKAGSWTPLVLELQRFAAKVRAVICFGQDGGMISDHLTSATEINVEIAPSMRSATQRALSIAGSGELVLFSPGCASFDEFSDFEHRGREFKAQVRLVAAGAGPGDFATNSAPNSTGSSTPVSGAPVSEAPGSGHEYPV